MTRFEARTTATWFACLLLGASGCRGAGSPGSASAAFTARDEALPTCAVVSGTRIDVLLGAGLSSETASVGDAWRGSVTADVAVLNGGVIPAGSPVEGVVAIAEPAGTGLPGRLQLGVRTIRVNGRDEPIRATTEPAVSPHRLVLADGTVLSFRVQQTVAMR